MSDEALVLKIKISREEGRTSRITVEIPESVRTALKATSIKEHKTQSELATEALIRFLTAPIGSYPVGKGRGGFRLKEDSLFPIE